ncbi:extracellular solute-binding protein [Amaricoccus sp.]|uniref:extracellular solute-binding protein n=1 Tax=Amaricoccus sp. TaxID=1872485 RepID=UPI002634B554|nr:extracellular solute-binding protein [Amaricoccus sp.]HRO09944.1 extracellular solute-binding protein [Amaricoccus sp.]
MQPIRSTIAAVLAALAAAPVLAAEVNVYSSRHYDTDEALYDNFTAATGIAVNRIEGSPEELIARLKAEGDNSPADIFLTVDAGRIWLADRDGLLQPVESAVLEERIPAHLRHPDGKWFGLSQRARVILYAKDRVENPPQTYEALADPAYKGKICIRSSSNVYNLSLMSAMIANHGEEAAKAWAEGLLANLARAPEGGDSDQIKGVVSGACDIAVANTYYFFRGVGNEEAGIIEGAENIGVIFPNQETTGTHVNVAAAGVAANAPNRDAAISFLEYLATPEAQAYFANQNYEYPAAPDAEVAAVPASFGTFTSDTLNLSALGENQPKAQAIFNEIGFP